MKISETSEELGNWIFGIPTKLSTELLRDITLIFAIGVYMVCYIYQISDPSIISIKEGMLTYIMIDVISYRIYEKIKYK